MGDKVVQEEKIDSEVYICDSCGGNMEYDISSKMLKCPYCDATVEIVDEGNIKEYSFDSLKEDEEASPWNNEMDVIKCEACGAETVVSKEATAVSCTYCGSSHILSSKQNAGIKPEGVLPFIVDRHKAEEISQNWFKKRWLAPNDLKVLYQSEKLHPTYVPYWTYDSQTYSRYRGEGGENYEVTVERDGEEVTETRIRWYRVNGRINRFFDDILVNASKNYDDRLMNQIEPFDTKALKSYKSEYMSGYTAERYGKDVKSCFEMAKRKMNSEIKEDARKQILRRYDHARIISVDTNYTEVTYKHVLLPIWSTYYAYKGKKYQYIINGQTGEIKGKAPYSWIKITVLVLLVIIVFALIYYFSN